MPSAVRAITSDITKFTNCKLVKGNQLVEEDLWINTSTGYIVNDQQVFYGDRVGPDTIVDLGGRILAPGLIDVQLNGAYGFDFSVIPQGDSYMYGKGVTQVNHNLITTGVTSYLPTITSQKPEVYQKALPYLAATSSKRRPEWGSESLGAHCEGPFINPKKNGIHNVSVLRTPEDGLIDLDICYGPLNLAKLSPSIKLITLAPELPGALNYIRELTARDIIVSIGHSDASYEEANLSIDAGATMITHLFNAMKPLHHRNPGIFGLLGTAPSKAVPKKPYFGIIADGIHLHPTSIKIAWHSHPDGLILVTDAMPFAGMPDGTYDWTNGSRIKKTGPLLTLEENGKIAGSSISLIECVNNFMNWTGANVPEALKAVTETPAKMLGVEATKGALKIGADADFVVLDMEESQGGEKKLVVDQVWKFGKQVFAKKEGELNVKDGQCIPF